MKDNIKVAIYFTISVVFMIAAYIGYGYLSEAKLNQEQESSIGNNKETRKKLKEFNLYMENGEKISSKEIFENKPMVINIWTSWCAYCDIEMKYFNELYVNEKDNVTVVMINATGDRDTKESAKKYVEDNGFEFDIYYDLYLDALESFGVYSYPTTIFVDKEGYVDDINVGVISREKLMKKVNDLK